MKTCKNYIIFVRYQVSLPLQTWQRQQVGSTKIIHCQTNVFFWKLLAVVADRISTWWMSRYVPCLRNSNMECPCGELHLGIYVNGGSFQDYGRRVSSFDTIEYVDGGSWKDYRRRVPCYNGRLSSWHHIQLEDVCRLQNLSLIRWMISFAFLDAFRLPLVYQLCCVVVHLYLCRMVVLMTFACSVTVFQHLHRTANHPPAAVVVGLAGDNGQTVGDGGH